MISFVEYYYNWTLNQALDLVSERFPNQDPYKIVNHYLTEGIWPWGNKKQQQEQDPDEEEVNFLNQRASNIAGKNAKEYEKRVNIAKRQVSDFLKKYTKTDESGNKKIDYDAMKKDPNANDVVKHWKHYRKNNEDSVDGSEFWNNWLPKRIAGKPPEDAENLASNYRQNWYQEKLKGRTPHDDEEGSGTSVIEVPSEAGPGAKKYLQNVDDWAKKVEKRASGLEQRTDNLEKTLARVFNTLQELTKKLNFTPTWHQKNPQPQVWQNPQKKQP